MTGWLLKIRRRANTTTIVALAVGFAFVALFILLYIYGATSTPAKIAGQITQFKDVELSYDTYQNFGISPLCGCMADKKAEEWRGITFLARHVQIARSGDSPMTGYMITSATPEIINWTPLLFRLRATVYSISLPKTEPFDPEQLVHNQLPPTARIDESKDVGIKDFLMFITDKPLNISLLGRLPLGGWIPTKGSTVALRTQKSMHGDAYSRNDASIEESYVPYNKSVINEKDDHIEFSETIDLPLGDFLGPDVVLWSEDSAAVVTAEKEVFPPIQNTESDRYNVKAIVVGDSAFSVRVAVEAFEKDEIQKYIAEFAPRDGKVFLPRRVRDSGKIVLAITDPTGQTPDFNQIYRHIKENPIIWVRSPTVDGYENEWNFRYPPLPPNEGFNIFGPVSSLTLGSALGSIMIGSKQYPITASSSLSLKNIHSLDVDGGVISVPVRLDTGKKQANVQLQATSEVFINDEPLNNRLDEHRTFSSYMLFVSPIISVLSLLVSLSSLIFKRKK